MKRWLILVITACVVGSGTGCSSKDSGVGVAPAKAEAAAPAPSTAAEPQFAASGPIVVENQVDILAQRDGVVARIDAEPGTAVRKGQLLAQLDDRQLVADRDAAKAKVLSIGYDQKNWEAKLKMDEVDLERAEKMMAADLITKEQLDHQRFKLVASQNELEREKQDYVAAQNALRSLELEIEKTRIMAPFDGVVARRYVRVGQKVSKDDRLFWVTATSPLRVKFTLPERYVGRVQRGDTVNVVATVGPETPYPAKVVQVSPVVDPASGTIEVLAELSGNPRGLQPGMTANVRLAGGK